MVHKNNTFQLTSNKITLQKTIFSILILYFSWNIYAVCFDIEYYDWDKRILGIPMAPYGIFIFTSLIPILLSYVISLKKLRPFLFLLCFHFPLIYKVLYDWFMYTYQFEKTVIVRYFITNFGFITLNILISLFVFYIFRFVKDRIKYLV